MRYHREDHDMTSVQVRCLACGLKQRNRLGGCRFCGHIYAEYIEKT